MATSALEFTLFMDAGGIVQGMSRARETVAAGLRGMAQAARDEGQRIQAALDSIASFRTLKQNVEDARATMEKSSAEATRLGAALGAIGPPTKAMKKEFDQARDAATAAEANFVRQSAALNALRTSMGAAGLATTGLAAAQTRLRGELAANEASYQAQARSMQRNQAARNIVGYQPDNSDRAITRVQAAYERLRASGTLTATELARAHVMMTERIIALQNGTDGWSTRLALVREQLVKLAVVGAGLSLAVKEAINFETAMSDVRKMVDFPTHGAFTDMRDDIKGMSREIPLSLEGLAQIAAQGGQMGVSAQNLRGFTDTVAKMSVAFRVGPAEAGDAMGKLMNIFRLSIPQAQTLGDAMAYLDKHSATVGRDILNVMNRVGGIAQVFGLTTVQTAALSSTFLSLGRPPEVAATSIDNLLQRLQTAPVASAEFKHALGTIGLSAEKMAADIRKDPQKALMTFLTTLKSLDSQTKSESLDLLFGREHAKDIAILIAGLDEYKKQVGLVANETNYAGTMQKEYSDQIKITQNHWQLAKNAMAEAAVNLGDAFLPAIVLVAKGLAELMHTVADLVGAFPNLAAAASAALTAFAGFGALKLVWSLMRAEVIGLIAVLPGLTAASLAFVATPLGAALTAGAMAAWVMADALKSNVQPLLDNASALGKSRLATEDKIKTLQTLQKTLAKTKSGTQEHVEAEEKLAQLLPTANLTLDEQGRVLARLSSATGDNSKKLKEYLDLLKKEDKQTLASQLDTQARAFAAAKEDIAKYTDGLRSLYGIGEKSQSTSVMSG